MSAFVAFLQNLLTEGAVTFTERPRPAAADRTAARPFLGSAYEDYRLEVAGPPLPFDADAAVWAGEFLWRACWFLVNHDEPEDVLEKELAPHPLTLPSPPGGEGRVRGASAAAHLSADLVLRFLPQVHRRARALAAADRLPALLATVLRQWPLTGVLADVAEGPLTPPEFDGHPGLLLLYAERLAHNEKPAWVPRGKAFEYVELVFRELGKGQSALLLHPAGAEKSEESHD
jgi:hypothetical protein